MFDLGQFGSTWRTDKLNGFDLYVAERKIFPKPPPAIDEDDDYIEDDENADAANGIFDY